MTTAAVLYTTKTAASLNIGNQWCLCLCSFTEHRKSVVLVFVLSQEALKQLASLVVTGVRTVSMYLKQ